MTWERRKSLKKIRNECSEQIPLRGSAAQVHKCHEGLAVSLVHPEPGDGRAALLYQRVREEPEA